MMCLYLTCSSLLTVAGTAEDLHLIPNKHSRLLCVDEYKIQLIFKNLR